MAYWVKGYRYNDASKSTWSQNAVIHRFDTLKEAQFVKSQLHDGEILDWGEGKDLKDRQKDQERKVEV